MSRPVPLLFDNFTSAFFFVCFVSLVESGSEVRRYGKCFSLSLVSRGIATWLQLAGQAVVGGAKCEACNLLALLRLYHEVCLSRFVILAHKHVPRLASAFLKEMGGLTYVASKNFLQHCGFYF